MTEGRFQGKVRWVNSLIYITISGELQRVLGLARPMLAATGSGWGQQVSALTKPERSALLHVSVSFTLVKSGDKWRATELQFSAEEVGANVRRKFMSVMREYNLDVEMIGDRVIVTFSNGVIHEFTFSPHRPDRTKDSIRRYAAEIGAPLPALRPGSR